MEHSAASELVWLSQEAYDRLREELEHLKGEGRREASAAIEQARAHGDIRENAEYHAAKEEQGRMEARIRQLETMLHNARVGESPEGDAVAAGMVVTAVDEDGDEMTFLVGSREDRSTDMQVVSPASPLGKAVLGRRIGERVVYQAPAGAFAVTITAARPLRQ